MGPVWSAGTQANTHSSRTALVRGSYEHPRDGTGFVDQMNAQMTRAGGAQPVGARVGDGGDATAPRAAAIDTRRKKTIEDSNAVMGPVSNGEHSAATHRTCTQFVQRPYRDAAG